MSRRAESIQRTVVVCTGSDCKKKGAKDLLKAVTKELKDRGELKHSVVATTRCCGLCKQAPVVCVDGWGWQGETRPKDLRRLLERPDVA